MNDRVTFQPLPDTFMTTEPSECPFKGFVRTFTFNALLVNISNATLTALRAKVVTITNGNLLLHTDRLFGDVGALLAVPRADGFADGALSPGESVDVPFEICLTRVEPFDFEVDVLGIVP